MLRATTLYSNPSSCSSTPPSLIPKHNINQLFKLQSSPSSSFKTLAQSSQGSETGVTGQEPPASFSGK